MIKNSSVFTIKVAGFPYTKVAAVPHTYTYGYPYAYYGKREAEVVDHYDYSYHHQTSNLG